jgi:hypothetical protein
MPGSRKLVHIPLQLLTAVPLGGCLPLPSGLAPAAKARQGNVKLAQPDTDFTSNAIVTCMASNPGEIGS